MGISRRFGYAQTCHERKSTALSVLLVIGQARNGNLNVATGAQVIRIPGRLGHRSWSSKAFASFRSLVSKPSVNQAQMGARRLSASARLP